MPFRFTVDSAQYDDNEAIALAFASGFAYERHRREETQKLPVL